MAGNRAKLRYNNLSYYDEDLNAIGKYCASLANAEYLTYMIDRDKEHLIVCMLVNNRPKRIPVYFTNLENALFKATGVKKTQTTKTITTQSKSKKYVVEYEGYGWTREDLKEIGNDIASLWGGSCYMVRVHNQDKRVDFYCIENGEKFVTDCAFSELSENKQGHLL